MKDAVIIFHRHPELGRVKTRLARSLGEEKALLIYKECSYYIINHILEGKPSTFIFLSDKNDLDKSQFDHKNLLFQSGQDLGQRMNNAFSEILAKGFEKVIIIATDTPDINNDLIENALTSLDSHDIVIGPSHDGGYYLLGMKKPSPFLFENMTWSHEKVLVNTMSKIKEKELRYELLEGLIDLDEESDLIEWLNSNAVHKNLQESLKGFVN